MQPLEHRSRRISRTLPLDQRQKSERQEIAPTAHRMENCEHVDTLEAIQTYEIFVFR